jgi:hypothetical protein
MTVLDAVSLLPVARKSESRLAHDRRGQLEGEPPRYFDGDHRKTLGFLVEFKRFMLMNRGMLIATDPLRKAAYFLSRIRGLDMEGWKLR